ncbi:unnamed protein product [Boreogadus saida]
MTTSSGHLRDTLHSENTLRSPDGDTLTQLHNNRQQDALCPLPADAKRSIPALDVSVAKHMGLVTNVTKGSITRRESRFIEIDKA